MEKPARNHQNYQWAVAVAVGIILVIGTFAFYALGIIRAHRDETNRQIFRGLSVIANDISENLDTLGRILPGFQRLVWDDLLQKKLDDLRQTPSYRDLSITRPANSMCNAGELTLLEFKQRVTLRVCGSATLEATISTRNVSDTMEKLRGILPSLPGLGSDGLQKQLEDLRTTLGYQNLSITRPMNSMCDPRELTLVEFKQSVTLRACGSSTLKASMSMGSLVDASYVGELVDVVMIADAEGTVLSETDDQAFAQLTSITPYLEVNGISATGVPISANDAKTGNANGRLFPGTQSTIVPILLSGREFLLFVQPHVLPLPMTESSAQSSESSAQPLAGRRFYVVGIVSAPGLLDSLGSLPVRIVGGVLGLLAILVISLPITKLGLVGADEKLQPRDAFLTFGAVLVIAAGLTVIVLDFAAYSALREQMGIAARSIAGRIGTQFDQELTTSLADLREAAQEWNRCQPEQSEDCADYYRLQEKYPPFLRFTVRDENSNTISPQLRYREREERTNVKDRPYFQAVLNGRLWTATKGEAPPEQFVLERVRSRTTGDKLYVLAVPPGNEVDPRTGANPRVMTVAKNFLTFRAPVLPPFYQFAVFDNATGNVIHHSDDAQSLLENFYTEFSRGEELRAAVSYQRSREVDWDYFDGDYLGRSRGLFVQPLGRFVPWSVAVFYDKNAIQGIHLDVVALTLAIVSGFAVLVMIPLIIGHYLSPEPRWEFAYQQQQPSRTRDYLWLSLVFVSYACFMLLSIQFLDTSAMVAFLAPLLVWPLVYLTIAGEPKPAWAIGLAWLVLIADLALSTTLIYGLRQSTALWISVVFLWMIPLFVVFPELRSALRRLPLFKPLFSTFDRIRSKPRTTVIRKRNALDHVALALAGLLIFAVVVIGAYRAINWIVMFAFLIWVGLLLLGVPAVAYALRRPLARISSVMWKRRPEQWNRAAYFSLGLTTLLLAGVVPATGVFHEMFDLQMGNLTRYGQAYLADAHRERYRTLQADVARIDPDKYAKADAKQIVVEPTDVGVYAQLFPSNQLSEDRNNEAWHSPPLGTINELYAAASFGQPVDCSNDSNGPWRLTAWVAWWVPGLDNTTAQLRQFLPRDQNSAGGNCWKFGNEEPVAMQRISGRPSGAAGLVWLGIAMMVVTGAAGLWFIIGLAARRFLACAIDHPGEKRDADGNQGMTDLAESIRAGQLNLLIGMPASQLDAFEKALTKGNSIPKVKSCIDKTIYKAGPESDISSESTILILTGMHLAFGSDKQLTRLLGFLEERNTKQLTTVVLSDVDPIDSISHPDRYTDFSDRKTTPDTEEIISRWIQLLNKSFIQYLREHHSSRPEDDALTRETQAFADLKRLNAQIRPLWDKKELTKGEMVEHVRRHAHGFYVSLWRLCSKKERVILYRLAQGYLVNPANAHDLVHLLEIGILRRDPAIRLPNESIKRFILSAETPERIEAWARGGRASTWSIVRIPLVGLILMLTVVISLMGRETTDYVVGLLTMIAALLPLVFQGVRSMAAEKPSNNAPSAG